jgi:hypothetical protein
MPLHDWQFWIVTLLALGGGWIVMRTVLPARRRNATGDPTCPNCASGSAAQHTKRRVALTIDRRKP